MQPLTLRVLDIVLSLLAIVGSSPIMLIILTAGLYDNGSPVFYQQRVGKNERLFTLVKFRSMKSKTPSLGTHLVDSSSVTRLGKFLRKTKLDELPQLFNILYGHMSLVGPRPCLPNQTKLIEERASRGIFDVRPGVTGLAQINDVDMSTPRKLARYDRLMIERLNPYLYGKIIIATALGRGRGDRVKTEIAL